MECHKRLYTWNNIYSVPIWDHNLGGQPCQPDNGFVQAAIKHDNPNLKGAQFPKHTAAVCLLRTGISVVLNMASRPVYVDSVSLMHHWPAFNSLYGLT